MAPSQYTCPCPLAQLPHAPPFHLDQLRHAQAGCPDCLDRLMALNDGLVHWVLRRFGTLSVSYDEALQAGRLGLWQALRHFDPARSTAFSSYAVPAIRRHVRQEGQQVQRFWRPLPLLRPLDEPDLLEGVAEALDRQRLTQAVPRWIDCLPPRQAALLRARYGCQGRPPQPLRALAQTLGITLQRVQQLQVEAQLRLALPLYSWPLRQQLGRTSTAEIQAALRAWRRFRQRRQRRSR